MRMIDGCHDYFHNWNPSMTHFLKSNDEEEALSFGSIMRNGSPILSTSSLHCFQQNHIGHGIVSCGPSLLCFQQNHSGHGIVSCGVVAVDLLGLKYKGIRGGVIGLSLGKRDKDF